MIKLNDTVSFVTSTGQQLVGVVDAFRGQGMADITTTDGMQLRQAVSALTPVKSNPARVNPMRTNPGPRRGVDLEKTESTKQKMRDAVSAYYRKQRYEASKGGAGSVDKTLDEQLRDTSVELQRLSRDVNEFIESAGIGGKQPPSALVSAKEAIDRFAGELAALREFSLDKQLRLGFGWIEQQQKLETELQRIQQGIKKTASDFQKSMVVAEPEKKKAWSPNYETAGEAAEDDIAAYRRSFHPRPEFERTLVELYYDPAEVEAYLNKPENEDNDSYSRRVNEINQFLQAETALPVAAMKQWDTLSPKKKQNYKPVEDKDKYEEVLDYARAQTRRLVPKIESGLQAKKQIEQQRKFAQAERTNLLQQTKELQERLQYRSLLDLNTDPLRAAYRIVPDPLRSSVRGDEVCGNALDGKAYVMAVSKMLRKVNHYLTWKDVGYHGFNALTTPGLYADVPRFQSRSRNKVYNEKTKRRRFERKPLTLDEVLTSKTLAERYGELLVTGLSGYEAGTLRKVPIERVDKGTNTRFAPLILQEYDGINPASGPVKTLHGAQDNYPIFYMDRKPTFVYAKDFNRRLGKGRGVQDYTLPQVRSERYDPGSHFNPEDPIIVRHVERDGTVTHYAYLMSIELEIAGEVLTNIFRTFSLSENKGRNPYFSWVRERPGQFNDLDESDPLVMKCSSREDLDLMAAFGDGLRIVKDALYRCNDLGYRLVADRSFGSTADYVQELLADPLGSSIYDIVTSGTPTLSPAQRAQQQDRLKELRADRAHYQNRIDTCQEAVGALNKALEQEKKLQQDGYREYLKLNQKAESKDAWMKWPDRAAFDDAIAQIKDELDEAREDLKEAQDQFNEIGRTIATVLNWGGLSSQAHQWYDRIEKLTLRHPFVVGELRASLDKASRSLLGCAFLTNRIQDKRTVSSYNQSDKMDFSVFSGEVAKTVYKQLADADATVRNAAAERLKGQNVVPDQLVSDAATYIAADARNLMQEGLNLKLIGTGFIAGTKRGGAAGQNFRSFNATTDKFRNESLKQLKTYARKGDAKELAQARPWHPESMLDELSSNPDHMKTFLLSMLANGAPHEEVMFGLLDAVRMHGGSKVNAQTSQKIAQTIQIMALVYATVVRDIPESALQGLVTRGVNPDLLFNRTSQYLGKNWTSKDRAAAYTPFTVKKSVSTPTGQRDVFVFDDGKFENFARTWTKALVEQVQALYASAEHEEAASLKELSGLITYMTERMLALIKTPFASTKFNPEAVVSLYAHDGLLSAVNRSTNQSVIIPLDERMTREEQIEQEPVWMLFSDLWPDKTKPPVTEADLQQYFLTFAPLRNIALAPKAASAIVKFASFGDAAKQTLYDNTRDGKLLIAEQRVPYIGPAQQSDPNIPQLLKNIIGSPTGVGAQVKQQDDAQRYQDTLSMGFRLFQHAVTGKTRLSQAADEDRKGTGTSIFYTYNPLLFELTRLYLPGFRARQITPFTGFKKLKKVKVGTTTEERVVEEHPELLAEIDALGVYGVLLYNFRQLVVSFSKKEGVEVRSPSQLHKALTAQQALLTEIWSAVCPSNQEKTQWDRMLSDILGDETGVRAIEFMQLLKKHMRKSLITAANLGKEGLYSEGRTLGPEGARYEETLQAVPQGKQEVDLGTKNQVSILFLEALRSVIPLLQNAASGYTKTFWQQIGRGERNLDLAHNEKEIAQNRKDPTFAELFLPIGYIFDPTMGNLLGLVPMLAPVPRDAEFMEKAKTGVLPVAAFRTILESLYVFRKRAGLPSVSNAPEMSVLVSSPQTYKHPTDTLLAKAKERAQFKDNLLRVVDEEIARSEKDVDRLTTPKTSPNPFNRTRRLA